MQLDFETQAYLDTLTSKTPNSLTDYQAGFLKARRDYLTPEQQEKFKDILSGSTINNLNYKELQTMAKARGLRYTRISKEKLIESLK
jgi:hypothetical protein